MDNELGVMNFWTENLYHVLKCCYTELLGEKKELHREKGLKKLLQVAFDLCGNRIEKGYHRAYVENAPRWGFVSSKGTKTQFFTFGERLLSTGYTKKIVHYNSWRYP